MSIGKKLIKKPVEVTYKVLFFMQGAGGMQGGSGNGTRSGALRVICAQWFMTKVVKMDVMPVG